VICIIFIYSGLQWLQTPRFSGGEKTSKKVEKSWGKVLTKRGGWGIIMRLRKKSSDITANTANGNEKLSKKFQKPIDKRREM
jgi:hypothetical protein